MQRICKGRARAERLGVVDQVVRAFHPRHRLATVLGFVLGGVVPAATYLEAHHDLSRAMPLYSQVATYLVLGGLLFSAKTVFAWGALAFRDRWKAAGFVVLLEGVMITSSVPLLALALLAILVAVNGIATGCILSLDGAAADGVPPARAAPLAIGKGTLAPRGAVRKRRPAAAMPELEAERQGDLFAA